MHELLARHSGVIRRLPPTLDVLEISMVKPSAVFSHILSLLLLPPAAAAAYSPTQLVHAHAKALWLYARPAALTPLNSKEIVAALSASDAAGAHAKARVGSIPDIK